MDIRTMLYNATPSIRQVRWYARAALSVYRTLELPLASERSRAYIEGLLEYLDAFDFAKDLVVASISRTEAGIRFEVSALHDGTKQMACLNLFPVAGSESNPCDHIQPVPSLEINMLAEEDGLYFDRSGWQEVNG